MADRHAAPVITGLAAGIAFVVLFASLSSFASPIDQGRKSRPNLSIEGLKDRHSVGESIDFVIRAKGYDVTCGYPVFKVIDIDRREETSFNSGERGTVIPPCEPGAGNIEMAWTLPGLGIDVPLVVDKIGHYKIAASLGTETAEEHFIVDNTAQLTIEKTSKLDEVRVFMDYYPDSEARVNFATICATEACETMVRVPSTVEYWYESVDSDNKVAVLRVSIEQRWDGDPEYIDPSCRVSSSSSNYIPHVQGTRIEQESLTSFLKLENSCPS